MDNPDVMMEEHVQYETEKALRNVYDDALSSHHVGDVNWKNETSLSKYDDGKYNIISERKALKKRFSKKERFNILSIDTDLFSYDIFYVDNLKLDKDNDEGKIGITQSSGDIFVEPLRNGINTDVDTYAHVSNMLWETSHDTIRKYFATEIFIKESSISIMIWNCFNEWMLINLVKNVYVPFGIPLDPKLFYKDGLKLEQV
ncbi:hypothetical protein Tco_0344743 [Tanacetum coccineum]